MATHSSISAWEIPWMEELGRLHTVHELANACLFIPSHFSCVRLCAPWTVVCQDPLSMGFSR